jgi:two-component system, sensor histidine kinase and response regulator
MKLVLAHQAGEWVKGRQWLVALLLLAVALPGWAQGPRKPARDARDTSPVPGYLLRSAEWETKGDMKEASRYLNLAAEYHWDRREYRDAIRYFDQSLALNQKINNQQGILGIQNNLGMIYDDLKEFDKSITYFDKVLDSRRQQGDKVAIIASLVNTAVVLNNLKQYEASVKRLEEALTLALELRDTKQMRSCYGMLAETYEKAGNNEKMLYYFELYRTFHEKTQRDREREVVATAEQARLRAQLAEAENRLKSLKINQQGQQIAQTQQQVTQLDTANRQLAAKITKEELLNRNLQQEARIKDLELASQVSEAQLSRSLAAGGIAGALLLGALAVLLWQNNRRKAATNQLLQAQKQQLEAQKQKLENQNEELETQKEELETQKEAIDVQGQELRRLNVQKDKLFSIVAHDLRNPFNGLNGLFCLLDEGVLTPQETKTMLAQVRQAGEATSEMLDNLLNWAKSQMGDGGGTNPQAVPLAPLATLVTQQVDLAARLKGVQVSHEVAAELFAQADAAQLEVILRNLASNAVKFTQPGGQVSLTAQYQNGQVEIAVRDTGVGISQPVLTRLLQGDFYTTKGTAQERGTGIGLQLCRDLAKANGGELLVTSQLGKGSTFTVVLPVGQPLSKAPAPAQELSQV